MPGFYFPPNKAEICATFSLVLYLHFCNNKCCIVHKSKTLKIRFLCRRTKYQRNAKLASNMTSHFRTFCVIYIGRFLAVLINIQVIRHKSKANSHQNYPQCHTLLSANIHIHGRCKRAIQRIPTLYGSFLSVFLK